MPHSYTTYTEISANAFQFNPKNQEVLAKKQEIINSIIQHHGKAPQDVLYYGFNPLMLAKTNSNISVAGLSSKIKKWLEQFDIKYTYIENTDLVNYKKKFDWVIAGEECFTFSDSEEEQRAGIEHVVSLARDVVVTTLRDYKNQEFKDREFSQPLAVRNNKDSKIFLEYHDYDYLDKNSWKTTVYEMLNSEVTVHGPFSRRSMFFKQMAKFSIDAGAKEFYVHKNLMYKSLIKKNYEHVISISL